MNVPSDVEQYLADVPLTRGSDARTMAEIAVFPNPCVEKRTPPGQRPHGAVPIAHQAAQTIGTLARVEACQRFELMLLASLQPKGLGALRVERREAGLTVSRGA